MNQPTTFWDTNLAATLIGGIIALAASVMPLIWAIRYDRHKTELDEHYWFLHLMTALLSEIDYITTCLTKHASNYSEFDQLCNPFSFKISNKDRGDTQAGFGIQAPVVIESQAS
jgi:hypothetical protein